MENGAHRMVHTLTALGATKKYTEVVMQFPTLCQDLTLQVLLKFPWSL